MAHSMVAPNLHRLSEAIRTPLAASGNQDAFARLSPGEQRIARALYDAQRAGGDSGPGWGQAAARARSLDEIAGMERGLAGWNQVFKQLKAEGLIAEQTLGHVVARWTRGGARLGRVMPRLAEALRAEPSPAPSRTA
jgi:hypothetical protein